MDAPWEKKGFKEAFKEAFLKLTAFDASPISNIWALVHTQLSKCESKLSTHYLRLSQSANPNIEFKVGFQLSELIPNYFFQVKLPISCIYVESKWSTYHWSPENNSFVFCFFFQLIAN